MISRPRLVARRFAILAAIGLVAACSSSGDGDSTLSEDDAEERIDAVLDVFDEAASEAGFDVDDDDDDDDNSFGCEGFEAFDDDDADDVIADDALAADDGVEPEPSLDDDRIVFEGGTVNGKVDVGVLDSGRLEEALDSVLADSDAFADCLEVQLSGDDDEVSRVFEGDVTVEEGDAGDQEVVVTFSGELTGDTQGYDYVLAVEGSARFVRVGQAAVVATSTLTGDGDLDPIESALDAAIDEFVAQFG